MSYPSPRLPLSPSDSPRRGEEFGVEDGRARRAAHRVVAERDEAVVEHAVTAYAPDGDAHAAASVAVEPGLRAVSLVAHDDGARGRRVQLQLLRQRGEGR